MENKVLVKNKDWRKCISAVQVRDDDWNITECTDQDGIHYAIWYDVQNKIFFLAESASICNGQLKEQFRYCADMAQSQGSSGREI